MDRQGRATVRCRRGSLHRSNSYLLFFAAAVVVAAIGAILIPITNHDGLCTVLLVGGDAAIITGLLAYIRKP